MPPLSCRLLLLLRFEDADVLELPDLARPVPEFLEDFALADFGREDVLVDLDEVARPFLVALLRVEDCDFDAEPFPAFPDLALEVEDLDLGEAFDRLDLARGEVEVEPDDPVERVVLADFARPDELLADVPLFDREELADFEALLDLVEADFAVPFFAVADLDKADLDEPLFDLDEADCDAPLPERDEADFAVPFFAFAPFAGLELLEPDLELDDFFAVAIVSPPLK